MKQELLVKKVNDIKKELSMLKERQEYLEDSLLSVDDRKALAEAREDLKQKRTISLSEMKKKLNM